ncbi:MAG: RbsD/FucU domain-containing protein [Aestuariivirga sp.]
MLIGIHPLLGPDLLHALQTMGHGDEIVIGDANFPASSLGPKVVRADGIGGVNLLTAILTHFPLDPYADTSAWRMAMVEDANKVPEICVTYQGIVTRLAGKYTVAPLERFAFYEKAKKAAYIVASGETAIYANIILKKGVVK